MKVRVNSRTGVIAAGCIVIAAFLLFTLWPRATLVDIGAATRGPMMVTIDEEAKTRVRERYVVSAPINGQLLRVGIDPGAEVVKDETIVAEMTPVLPAALDIRTKEQAQAAVEAARAGLSLARAEASRARADADFAADELARARELFKGEALAKRGLDRAEIAHRSAIAALEAAKSAVTMRAAELERAQAVLKPSTAAANGAAQGRDHYDDIEIKSPVSGHVLRVFQESEAVLSAGSPILEVGDPHADLEVVAELLSSDAVKVSPADRVIIDKWGGVGNIEGIVNRIEPLGFTKVSALGVEEQRVNTIIDFAGRNDDERLGDGYRVEVRIVIWEDANALRVPASALFRVDGDWAVYRVEGGRARRTIIAVGRNNGVDAQVLDGLEEGDRIILFPGAGVGEGTRVKANAPA
ncbi:MAG: HlyD family efflux transporter periplasmic adaptor subunit [Parvularculaceae bacterium]|nr:HlyD family efflux transporter periplasmic adaptor subunit [Parvularculaceae bacterium]